MPNELYLVSTKTKKEYKVISFDKEKKELKLQSDKGTPFSFPDATKEAIKAAGYELVQR